MYFDKDSVVRANHMSCVFNKPTSSFVGT
jgi:hypothetical protein